MKINCIVILFFLLQIKLFCQTDSLNIKELSKEQILNLTIDQLQTLSLEELIFISGKLGVSIDDLLNQKVRVGSQEELSPRETPGIVSVIERDEIVKSGAADLIDVLNLVPGIAFGLDVDGVLGLSMRGIWGLEGKILVMIDGMEINEGLYTSVNFGKHFSPEQIERIEIIRGPGSSLYGGYAELGVINIITRKAEDINGLMVHTGFGKMTNAWANSKFGIQGGTVIKNTELSVLADFSTGNRSDQKKYVDFDSVEYAFNENYSKYQNTSFNIGLRNKNFAARVISDDYSTQVTGYSENTKKQI
ncbi:MAG: TonB-dependent receptor plug domain-containing protein [Bacteroidales bacterium]|nr:TonB-dependent receptor plug domain-containing protein [Bacteroidales bacterium]